MNPLDIAIILAVVAAVALCVRSIVRGQASECSTCGDAGCTARNAGGHCRAADDMLRRASEALDKPARTNAG